MSKHSKHWRSWTRNPYRSRSPRDLVGPKSRPGAVSERLEDRTLFSTFTVTNSLDDGSAGSLRWAIGQANASRGLDTIELETAGRIMLTRGELDITDHLAIVGGGSVSGNNTFRVFNIAFPDVHVRIEDLSIRDGRSSDGNGGAIFNAGHLGLTDCDVGNSSAGANGGGIYNTGTAVLSNCFVGDNTAVGNGGGIYNDGGTVTVAGGFINIPGGMVPTFSSIGDNHAFSGGGIYNAEGGRVGLLQLTRVWGNSAQDSGGGIFNSGTLSVVSSNVAYNGANYAGGGGGGILNEGTATLTDSALFLNGSAGAGGGIANAGGATLTNCTVSSNTALGGGGGISNQQDVGVLLLNNCTITSNMSILGGVGNAGTATLNNTIVADSNSGDVVNRGTLTGSHNLIEDGSGGPGLVATVAGDPRLGPRANNGGGTVTHALLAGSPAINAGNTALIPAGVTRDQTGSARVVDSIVDIGAFEFRGISTTAAVTTSAASTTYGGAVTFTATVTAASAPAGGVQFVIDGGTPVAGVPAGTTGTTATWTYTTSALAAGTHAVVAVFDGSGDFADSTATLVGGQTVNRATATVVVTPYAVTYDGATHAAAVASITGVNSESGDAVGAVTLSGAQTNAGTYNDTWSFTGGANYNDIAATAITNVIHKASSTTTVTIAGGPFTYTGVPQAPAVVTVTGAGGLALTPAATYADNVNAGTATAGYAFVGDANHEPSSDSEAFVIGRADAAVQVTPYAVTYDGTPHAAAYTVVGVNDETGAAVGTIALSPAHTDAGTYADGWSFTAGPNYNDLAGGRITNTIHKAASTVVLTITGGPFTYNGLPQTPATVTVTGAGGLNLTPAAGYADNVNAGTATASYSYPGDANHEPGTGSTAFTINRADAAVVVTPYAVTYDGTPHAATVTSIVGVNGQAGAAVGAVTLNTTHVAAGTYADTWTFTGTANYNDVAATSITNVINKAALTVTANDDTKVFGTVKTFAGTAFTQAGLVAGDTITGVTATSTGANASAAVGTYPIAPGAAAGTGLGNYDITYVSGTLRVFPPLTVPAGVRTAYEDVDATIGGISIAGGLSGSLTLTLGVSHGTLTLGTTAGLTTAGNGSGSVTLTGTTAALNAALAGLAYRGGLNYSGGDTLSLALGNGSFSWSAGVAIAVVSAAQQVVNLQAQVNAMLVAGRLTSGQGEALNLNLRDNNGDAGKVQAFLNQVNGYLSGGTLTRAEADALSTAGNVLLLGAARR